MKEITIQNVTIFSLPVMVVQSIAEAVRAGDLTGARLFRRVRRAWRDWSLMRDVRISEREFAEGKCKELTRFEDLFE